MKKARIVTKSKERDRLITPEELLISHHHFYKGWKRVRNAIPMHLIMWFAIYSGRREGEICRMRLDDFDKRIVNGKFVMLKIQTDQKEIINSHILNLMHY